MPAKRLPCWVSPFRNWKDRPAREAVEEAEVSVVLAVYELRSPQTNWLPDPPAFLLSEEETPEF